jgi:hypothetical protein
MTKPNFDQMTRQELRAYVLQHRDDEEAFHALCDRIYATPGIKIDSMEQLEQLLKQRTQNEQPE